MLQKLSSDLCRVVFEGFQQLSLHLAQLQKGIILTSSSKGQDLWVNSMGAKQGKLEVVRLCDNEHSGVDCSSASDSYSVSVPRMKERRNQSRIDKKAEIETSKSHWSETVHPMSDGEALAADNLEVFQSLKKKWPSAGEQRFSWKPYGDGRAVVYEVPLAQKSFWNWHHDDLVVHDKYFAAGGQAKLFEAVGKDIDEELVLKVFKQNGISLRELQKQWPQSMLEHESTRSSGYFSGGRFCNGILGATMTKNGRFAFIMPKCWGDLRKLINLRMEHNNNQGPPFPNYAAIRCMWQIAKGMQDLHAKRILHRDLKASNVLVKKPSRYYREFDPIQDNDFTCKVADYECSVGVKGTGFWRAPEVLQFLKNLKLGIPLPSELFTEKSDVYSYSITCYEILTGGIPFPDVKPTDYDSVISGTRPNLPTQFLPAWIIDLLTRCWDANPSKRPPFQEIVEFLESNAGFQLDSTNDFIL